MDLTKQDYTTLIDAVEAWEKESNSGRMLGSLMGAMLCRNDEERQKMKESERIHEAKLEVEIRTRKERGILLKAKLLQLRDGVEADELLQAK